jgi:hypothetical protein
MDKILTKAIIVVFILYLSLLTFDFIVDIILNFFSINEQSVQNYKIIEQDQKVKLNEVHQRFSSNYNSNNIKYFFTAIIVIPLCVISFLKVFDYF